MKRAHRIAAITELMWDEKVDLVLAASNGLHQIDQSNPVVHLTGFLSTGCSFALLDKHGAMTVIAAPASEKERLDARLPDPVRRVAADDLPAAVATALSAHRSARIGHVNFDALPHALARQVLNTTPDAVAFEHLYAATAPKIEEEILAARKGTELSEIAYEKLNEIARPGMRECDVALEINFLMKSLGANDSFFMFNASPSSDAIMPPSERRIEQGDLLLCELSPSVDGQFVQICRTTVVGEPSNILTEKYELLCKAMMSGIELVRPGVPMSEICQSIDDQLSDAGYAQYSRPPFIRRRGHGLGAGSFFPGDVAVDNPVKLETGMLFMVHPNQFLPETGYMMCGEPVLVTDSGVEVLTRRTPGLAVAAG